MGGDSTCVGGYSSIEQERLAAGHDSLCDLARLGNLSGVQIREALTACAHHGLVRGQQILHHAHRIIPDTVIDPADPAAASRHACSGCGAGNEWFIRGSPHGRHRRILCPCRVPHPGQRMRAGPNSRSHHHSRVIRRYVRLYAYLHTDTRLIRKNVRESFWTRSSRCARTRPTAAQWANSSSGVDAAKT